MFDSKKRMLFVDDEPNVLETLGRMLAQVKENWEGVFCSSVDDALEALHGSKFDTVVTDIRMPGKDGLALLEAMRDDADLRNIPIIVLTGKGDRTLKRRVLNLGATDLLNKPVAREDLVARLRSAIRLKDYYDQLANQVDMLDGLVRERTKQLERSHREVMWRLAKAGEYRDDQTGNHVARVAWCSRVVAEGLRADPEFTELLFQTSPLHDIGKIGIPDRILLKPGLLTPEERIVIEQHTTIGENILRQPPKSVVLLSRVKAQRPEPVGEGIPSALTQIASVVARNHHEKWDGTGYPDRLAGEDIPLAARIVGLVDVYDALLSKRPYKAAMSKPEAVEILQKGSGHHFDPRILECFLDIDEKIKEVYDQFGEVSGSVSANEVAG